jgi:hypothetical protein
MEVTWSSQLPHENKSERRKIFHWLIASFLSPNTTFIPIHKLDASDDA